MLSCQTKNSALCFAWTPSSFHQFCKARFPLGGGCRVSLLLHPPIDIPEAPGDNKSTQTFVTLKVHLRHLCPRWVIILGSDHILQNENNKETFDQKPGRRWEKQRGGWRAVKVCEKTRLVCREFWATNSLQCNVITTFSWLSVEPWRLL